jgi:hypothetical protein
MTIDKLGELRKHATLYDRAILTDIEVSGSFFHILTNSPDVSVSAACDLLSPSVLEVVRYEIRSLRDADYLCIPFLMCDPRTNEQKVNDAAEMVPEVKRVCDAVEHWLDSNPDL